MEYDIQEIKTDEQIFSVATTPNAILFGGKSKRLRMYTDTETTLWHHKKSIRHIASKGNFFGSASYDCTAAIFKDNAFLDVVEGPETEIKCLSFSDDTRFLAMSTRGKTVWICKILKEIEIDAVLEDHLHDVKGVRFHDSILCTFGYDNTIKVYERFDLDESWELVQSLEEDGTVWSVDFRGDVMVSCNDDGKIRKYAFSGEWRLMDVVDASVYPICSMVLHGDAVCYVLNRDSIGVLDMGLKVIGIIEGLGEINCLYSCMHRNALVCGMDNGTIKLIKLRY